MPFAVDTGGPALSGEHLGEGTPVVLAHGLTATRRYVLHGSAALTRAGRRLISYDARGHGLSAAAPEPSAYRYSDLADDLERVITAEAPGDLVLAGHSMGTHTIACHLLRGDTRARAAVLAGPVSTGEETTPSSLANWDALADGLERSGVEGFIEAYDHDMDPEWRDTLLRLARDRLGLHSNLNAVADAIRAVARDQPFDSIDELARIEIPVLIVASHDEADPSHPYAVAERWAEIIPNATLISEEPGESPLAWQGGRLSRAIAEFTDSL